MAKFNQIIEVKNSSFIEKIAFNKFGIFIKMKNSNFIYGYKIPNCKALFNRFLKSASKGKFYNKYIKFNYAMIKKAI